MDSNSELVPKVLNSKGLYFDHYMLNTGGETSNVKVKQMTELMNMYPNAKRIILFEDRVEHFPKFQAFGDALNNVEFDLVKIVPPEVRH